MGNLKFKGGVKQFPWPQEFDFSLCSASKIKIETRGETLDVYIKRF